MLKALAFSVSFAVALRAMALYDCAAGLSGSTVTDYVRCVLCTNLGAKTNEQQNVSDWV